MGFLETLGQTLYSIAIFGAFVLAFIGLMLAVYKLLGKMDP